MSKDLTHLADALKQLQPAAALDRDTILYQAGRASAPTSWRWPLATLTISVVALAFGAMLLFRPALPAPARVVYVPIQVEPEPTPEPDVMPPESVPQPEPSSNFVFQLDPWKKTRHRRLEEQVSRWGLDALPPLLTPPAPTPDAPKELDAYLDSL